VGVAPAMIAQLVARRSAIPFRNTGELQQALGSIPPRLSVGGNTIWTLRATARLRGPGEGLPGSSAEVVRTASAVVKLLDRRVYWPDPVPVLRYYEDAWSQDVVRPAAGPGGVPLSISGAIRP
jgi:hypothetical protein